MSREQRPAWQFDYAPFAREAARGTVECDLVVATTEDVDPARIVALIGKRASEVSVTPLFNAHPVFWTRVESSTPIDIRELTQTLDADGVNVRYVASARQGSQALPPALDFSEARLSAACDWKGRPTQVHDEQDTPWRWFLRSEGADVNRALCGTGAGTRLAVIDDDGRDLDRVQLDAEVLVGIPAAPRAQSHAAMLVGWAVGGKRDDRTAFSGVAPDASPRVYVIPKPGLDAWALPLAILRAVSDGADVVVCATYVEGLTSPLLDDALEVAVRLGRGGRGTAVLMPTGREMSSAEGSTHSSLSLSMGDPASDARVLCVGPSARDGAWFLWRDRRGMLRPFANRGPAVRFLAPGDDMAYPFSSNDRPAHAESSGASAVAGGILLLLLSRFPELTLRDAEALLRVGLVRVDPARQALDPELADRRDLQPLGVDRDDHNAKHGYGRLSAQRSCMAAADPIAQTLVRLGDADAATRYFDVIGAPLSTIVSSGLFHWAALRLLREPALVHSFASIVRALRLTCGGRAARRAAETSGQWLRQLGVLLRELAAEGPSPEHESELWALDARLRGLASNEVLELEARLLDLWRNTWASETSTPSCVVELSERARASGAIKAPGARS